MLRRRSRCLWAFRHDQGGVSAVEFALILPAMLVAWAGFAEMSRAISAWRRVTILSRTVADLTSKGDVSDPIGSATMSDILASSNAVLLPFSGSSAEVIVSAMGIYLASPFNPVVCSSIATDNNARRVGVATDLAIPAGYGSVGNRYLFAEVSMPYRPMLGAAAGKLLGGSATTITLRTSFAWPVRNGVVHNSITSTPEVTMPSGSPCP